MSVPNVMVGVLISFFLKACDLSLIASFVVPSLIDNRSNSNRSIDHREGRQDWIKVGVDQIAGFLHGSVLI